MLEFLLKKEIIFIFLKKDRATGFSLWSVKNLSEQSFYSALPDDCFGIQTGSQHWSLATKSYIGNFFFRYLIPSW